MKCERIKFNNSLQITINVAIQYYKSIWNFSLLHSWGSFWNKSINQIICFHIYLYISCNLKYIFWFSFHILSKVSTTIWTSSTWRWKNASTITKFHRKMSAISEHMHLENSCHLLRRNCKMYFWQRTNVQPKTYNIEIKRGSIMNLTMHSPTNL
jgi:hypothetical protein